MSRYLHNRYKDMIPYVPGEQPQNREYIKLNTNENPYPPSPDALKALENNKLNKLNLYPDPSTKSLIDAIAQKYNVNNEQIIIGNGSDEILAFCFQAFCGEGIPACFPDLSYGFYPVFADLYSLTKKVIKLKEDFSISVSDYFNANATIFVANPNAPTGIALSLEQIRDILKSNIDNIVVIDEAYVDFGADSSVELLDEFENLIVIKTFSKSCNLAGARLGYAIASKEVIRDLNTIKFSFNPYNVNSISLILGEAVIKDEQYLVQCLDNIKNTRQYTIEQLETRNFKVLPSKANFVFASHPIFCGKDYYNLLKNKGILVRYFDLERTKKFVRITIGTKKQMDALLKATDEMEV